MESPIVQMFYKLLLTLCLAGLMTGILHADTIHLTDGQTMTGELVSPDDRGFIVKNDQGAYSDRIPWAKLTQDDLRQLQQNPKFANFVEPFVEVTQEERAQRTEIPIKEVTHPARPASSSLLGAMFSSGIGIFLLLVLYAGNIYASYEISIFRARPKVLVCGMSAVLPIVTPILFLSLPPQLRKKEEPEWQPPTEEYSEGSPGGQPAGEEQVVAEGQEGAEPAAQAPAHAPAANLPPTKTFSRGQYTFNRRFFETQLAAFFGVVRSESTRDMVVKIRSARGEYVCVRVVRVSANEIQMQVQKHDASEDVSIPYVEIQEVQIKHKDA